LQKINNALIIKKFLDMQLERFLKSVKRFSGKNAGYNKKLERFTELSEVKIVLVSALFFCLIFVSYSLPLQAQDQDIPHFFGSNEQIERPNLSRVARLRFLTTVDFPPFNYIDSAGNLAGYHIDLVRSICLELKLSDRCQIEAVAWEQLGERLKNHGGEAIIAGLAVTGETRADFAFSRSYMRFPARFVAARERSDVEALAQQGEVGIVKNTAHEKMFAAYFPEYRIRHFDDYEMLTQALREGKLSLAFGDGLRLSHWLASPTSDNCCHFIGGAYYSSEYLGQGLRIAVSLQNKNLLQAFDYALTALEKQGKLTELYFRYFPVGFY